MQDLNENTKKTNCQNVLMEVAVMLPIIAFPLAALFYVIWAVLIVGVR